MAITTLAGLRSARKHRLVHLQNTPTGATQGLQCGFKEALASPDQNGVGPALAVLDGMVPVSNSPGYLNLPVPAGSNKLYLSRVEYTSQLTTQHRFEMFDCLFVSGEHSTNGTVTNTYTSPPTSWQSRVPNYDNLEIWIEVCIGTAGVAGPDLTGSTAIVVDYKDADGVTQATPSFLIPNLDAGMAYQLPLQAGTKGVSELLGYNSSGGTSATAKINVRLMNPLAGQSYPALPQATSGAMPMDFLQTGLVEVHPDAALFFYAASSTSARSYEILLELAEG